MHAPAHSYLLSYLLLCVNVQRAAQLVRLRYRLLAGQRLQAIACRRLPMPQQWWQAARCRSQQATAVVVCGTRCCCIAHQLHVVDKVSSCRPVLMAAWQRAGTSVLNTGQHSVELGAALHEGGGGTIATCPQMSL
jgi:hypothetical protein